MAAAEDSDEQSQVDEPVPEDAATAQRRRKRVAELIRQLDSERFADRNDAARQLLDQGPHSIAQIVESLGSPSREIRFRVQQILLTAYSFDEVAPVLIDAVAERYGNEARLVLRQRAMRQMLDTAGLKSASTLLKFWQTDYTALHRQVAFDLDAARTRDQVAAAVAPLLGLEEKTRVFDLILQELATLSLSADHQHSPGYSIAETLAKGLRQGDQASIEFAQQYVAAFRALMDQLRKAGQSDADIRKEVTQRANMSDGAMAFLARTLSRQSGERRRLSEEFHVQPEMLKNEFFRGLAQLDTSQCYRLVGKVHIADMLLSVTGDWPEMPREGVLDSVVQCIVTTISSGDKRKALALLDAIEGCAELQRVGMPVSEGVGQRMAQRLCLTALAAPDSRSCHSVRAIHDRVVKIVGSGVAVQSELFPAALVEPYLNAEPESTSEESRRVLGYYATILEDLAKVDRSLVEQDGVCQFLALIVGRLTTDPDLAKSGLQTLTALVRESRTLEPEQRVARFDAQLREWAAAQRDAS